MVGVGYVSSYSINPKTGVAENTTVVVSITVKNIGNIGENIAGVVKRSDTGEEFIWQYAWLAVNATATFNGAFSMGTSDVTLTFTAMSWQATYWSFDSVRTDKVTGKAQFSTDVKVEKVQVGDKWFQVRIYTINYGNSSGAASFDVFLDGVKKGTFLGSTAVYGQYSEYLWTATGLVVNWTYSVCAVLVGGTIPPPTKGTLSVVTNIAVPIFLDGVYIGDGSVSVQLDPAPAYTHLLSFGIKSGYDIDGNRCVRDFAIVAGQTTTVTRNFRTVGAMIPLGGQFTFGVPLGELCLDPASPLCPLQHISMSQKQAVLMSGNSLFGNELIELWYWKNDSPALRQYWFIYSEDNGYFDNLICPSEFGTTELGLWNAMARDSQGNIRYARWEIIL